MDFASLAKALSSLDPTQTIIYLILITIFNIPHIYNFIKRNNKEKTMSSDIKLLINDSIKKAIKVFDIKNYQIISEQRHEVNRTLDSILSLLLNHYKELNDSRREVRAYEKILFFVISDIKGVIMEWIKQNHLLEFTELEFQQYVCQTVKQILQSFSLQLDREYYSDDFSIDRDSLKKSNYADLEKEIELLLSKLLYDCKEITYKKTKEISKIEAEE